MAQTKKELVKEPKKERKEEQESKIFPKKFATYSTVSLKQVPFEQLPGWDDTDVKKSLLAFQNSCKTFLKQKASQPVGSKHIDLQAGDWHPACEEALTLEQFSESEARHFFEKWFKPVKFENKQAKQGLFTGYYMPQLKGSLKRTNLFKTPIYGLPKNLKLAGAPVIAWINSPVDRAFLEIEGSGVIRLPNGKKMYLGYAGENGGHFTSLGSALIKEGIMTKHNASQKAIKRYLKEHPEKTHSILNQNKSLVFFQNLKHPMALGAKGMALTPGYSLAIDRKWIPMGAPLWLSTTTPIKKEEKHSFHRLMIAQDTGGAIRGLIRGDIYWGSGKTAAYLGEHMKDQGRYWLLLPKLAIKRLAHKFGVQSP